MKVSLNQAMSAFAKYQIECPADGATGQYIFTSWLEADGGAFDKYVNGNSAAKPSQSLEEFKKSASIKPILSKNASNYDLPSKLPADANMVGGLEPRCRIELPIHRPSDYLHVYYAVQSYTNSENDLKMGLKKGWELLDTYEATNGYFGVAYLNEEKKHIIIAHRGTEDLKDLLIDLDTITRHLNRQEPSAWNGFTKKIIKQYGPKYSYSFTGHSLGGWLAQVCLWKYQDEFIRNQRGGYKEAFAVTLDEPGAKEVLDALQPRCSDYKINIDNLDITNYLSCPNIVNTIMGHVGTVYGLSPELKLSWLHNKTLSFSLAAHNSETLLGHFSPDCGLPFECTRVLDWPKVSWGARLPSASQGKSSLGYALHMTKSYVNGDIKRDEYTGFYKYDPNDIKNPHTLSSDKRFHLQHGIHYRTELFNILILPLRNMPRVVRKFLEDLSGLKSNRGERISKLTNGLIDEKFSDLLNSYNINADTQELIVINGAVVGGAREFRDKIINFLNTHEELCKHIETLQESLTISKLVEEVRAIAPIEQLAPIADELPSASFCFVGREKELNNLGSAFKDKNIQIVAIRGIAGVGKSQLAAEFAHKCKIDAKPYKLIRWLKAGSREELQSSYHRLGDDLGIEREVFKESLDLKRAINNQLLRYERVLLIYDNVESLDYFNDYQPSAGGNASVHILITTQSSVTNCKTFEVKEFSPLEIQSYLNILRGAEREVSIVQAQHLGEELGFLPLALVHAGAYMEKYGKDVKELFGVLRNEKGRQMIFEESVDRRLKTIATLWNITLAKLSVEAVELIHLCSYLHPDGIPRTLLEQMVDEELRDDVLYELRSQSLLVDNNNDKSLFKIHRLLQEVMRRRLANQDYTGGIAKAIIEKAVDALNTIVYNRGHTSTHWPYLFWKKHHYLNSQILCLIAEGRKLKIREALLADLLELAGEYQGYFIPNYAESLKLYQQCLDIRKVVCKDNYVHVAQTLGNIGKLYTNQGQYDQALIYEQQALEIYEGLCGDKHPIIAQCFVSIGTIYILHNHQFGKALEYQQKALTIRQAFYDDNHPDVADSFLKIGDIYKWQECWKALEGQQAQYDQALQYKKSALKIYEAIDAKHPKIWQVFSSIGSICSDQGQYGQAIEYYQKALAAIQHAIYDDNPNNPEIAFIFTLIGQAYHAQGQFDMALKNEQQALQIYEAIYNDNHRDIAFICTSIGNTYEAQGQFDEALKQEQRALKIYEAIDAKHPEIEQRLYHIALLKDKLQAETELPFVLEPLKFTLPPLLLSSLAPVEFKPRVKGRDSKCCIM